MRMCIQNKRGQREERGREWERKTVYVSYGRRKKREMDKGENRNEEYEMSVLKIAFSGSTW